MDDLDDPSTFRGQLQRGRGIAFRRAQSLATAADAVYECILDDPRWDRQTEARSAYLAALLRTLNLPLAPIEEHLSAFDDDDPDDIGLLLDVLAESATAGSPDAISVLRRYVRDGKHWSTMLNAVLYSEPIDAPGVLDELAADALACRTDAEVRQAIDDGDDDWMHADRTRRRWVERSRAKGEPNAMVAVRRERLQAMAALSRGDLLETAAQSSGQRRWALEELGRRGDQIVLDLVEDPSLRNSAGAMPGAARALKHLGAPAVPRARLWMSDPAMAPLAIDVLAALGDQPDVPALTAEFQRAFDDDDLWWHAETPAEGLGRLRVSEAAPLLRAGWERTVHSHARAPFLTALHRCAPADAQDLADEGRDDCEPAVREVAAAIHQPGSSSCRSS